MIKSLTPLDEDVIKPLLAKNQKITVSCLKSTQYHQVTELGILCFRKVDNKWVVTKIFTVKGKTRDRNLTREDYYPDTWDFFEMNQEKLKEFNETAAPKEAYELFAKSILGKQNVDGSKYPLIMYNGFLDIIQLSKLAGLDHPFMPHEYFETHFPNIELIDVKFMIECLMAHKRLTLMMSSIENMATLLRVRFDEDRVHQAGYDTMITWMLYQKVRGVFKGKKGVEEEIDYRPYQGFICRLGHELHPLLGRFDLALPQYY